MARRAWSKDEIEKVGRRHFDEGVSFSDLAHEMGVTRGAIKGLLSRHFPDRSGSLRDASAAIIKSRDEQIREAVRHDVERGAEYQTAAAEVAAKFNLSPKRISAIVPVGKGLSAPRGPRARVITIPPVDPDPVAKPGGSPAFAGKRPSFRKNPLDRREIDLEKADALEGPITSAGKTFIELGDHECRYSIGKDVDGNYRFCGEPRAMDHRLLRKPYCVKHGALAVKPTENRELRVKQWMLNGYTEAPEPANDDDPWLSEAA